MDSLSNFFNVFGDVPAGGEDRALDALLAAPATRSLPCVIWVSRPATLFTAHEVPPTVTLSFAPGAVLTLNSRLTIRGELDAGLEPRFELRGGAVLELLGQLDEIVADWWRPSLGLNPVEHALRALWTRYAHEDVLPAPIRLDGPYALTNTLRVKPSPDVPRAAERIEVMLRGQWFRPEDPPTFEVGPVPPTGTLLSLLSVEEGVVLTIDHVAFDAEHGPSRALAQACLSFEGTFDGSRIEACSFRHAAAGVLVSRGVQRTMENTGTTGGITVEVQARLLNEAIARSLDRPNRLEVSRCLFTGVSIESGALDLARGIDVRFGAPTSLSVRDSQFVGAFANGVAILGGDVTVTACQFANTTTRIFFYGSAAATADVLVRRWGDDAARDEFTFDDKAWPVSKPDYQGKAANVYRGQPLANTHVTITHCVSTSPTFLVMNQTFSYSDTILGGAVLTNVRHAPPAPRWHSVALGPGMPPRSLILQGCRFGDSVILDRDSGGDVVSGRVVTQVVVDLGTTFDHEPRFTLGADFGSIDVVTLASPSRAR